jgi:3-phosphoshikimate 1-carboxyvinyltransferase
MNGWRASQSVVVRSGGPIDIDVVVPGSKSIANRALVIASLATGASTLTNVPDGDDVSAMRGALGVLGVDVRESAGAIRVEGPLDFSATEHLDLDARLAGTTSRFLIALSALRHGRTTISGEGRLRERPFAELVEAIRHLGANVEGGPGLPISVSRGDLRGGTVSMNGSVSSQFVSALMMIGPRLADGLRIELAGDVVSGSYIAMTGSLMTHFGARVTMEERVIEIAEGEYLAANMDIEPDASSASYPAAFAAIAGGSARIKRAATIRLQSDRVVFEILRRMGCSVEEVGDDILVHRDPSSALQALDVDLRDSSDLVPTIAAVAATARGTTRIRGVGFIRQKESDRIGDLAVELRRFGLTVQEDSDGLDVVGGELDFAVVDPHHDHRLAMALALLGWVAKGTVISDPRVVAKSWPTYFADLGLNQ